jgi:predicted nucleic acid-binding protein
LILEYEAVGKREAQRLKIPESTVEAIVRAFCSTGREVNIYFNLRPFLPDPGDEFLLDLAVAGRGDVLVTHNARHFPRVDRFGIRVMTPGEFLRTTRGEGL